MGSLVYEMTGSVSFTQVQFFLFFEKNENRLCPLPYEEVLEAIFRLFGQNNVEISEISDD